MPKNWHDGVKQVPTPLEPKGKGYERALRSRSQAILNTLMGYLASNYASSIPSTNYSAHLSAVARELAKLTLTLEDQTRDIGYEGVRSEFLHQIIGYMLFVGAEMPDLGPGSADEDFKAFLLRIISLFFQGSIPRSIEESVELFMQGQYKVVEVFRDVDPLDISRQFEFVVDLGAMGSSGGQQSFNSEVFRVQQNIEALINIIKPAHTLYSLRHIFHDEYQPGDDDDPPHHGPKVEDDAFWHIHDYQYEDVRKFCHGVGWVASQTGQILAGDLGTLWDTGSTGVDNPLCKVHRGCRLRIISGPNQGLYTVTGTHSSPAGPSSCAITVFPRFNAVQGVGGGGGGVQYEVEMDRMGHKGQPHAEDVSGQFG